jgi:hypothetical protein
LLAARPGLAGDLLAAHESLFTLGDNRARFPIFSGETVFALKSWDAARLQAALPAVSPAAGRRDRFTAALAAHRVRWLGWPDHFVPGVFQSRPLEVRLPAEFFPGADAVFQRWLQASHVPFCLRRTPHGYRLDFAPPRRAWLTAAEMTAAPAEFIARLTIGPKFDLGGWLAAWGTDGLFRQATAIFGGENEA